jgi:ATP-binding cassette subfamily B protein
MKQVHPHDAGVQPNAAHVDDFHALLWPLHRLGEALPALAAAAGLPHTSATAPALPTALALAGGDALAHWLDGAATRLGLQAEPVQTALPDLPQLLRQAAPALLQLPTPAGPRLALLLASRGRWLWLLGPDGRRRRCALATLRDALAAPWEAPLRPGIDALLVSAGVPPARQPRARAALLAQRLAGQAWHGTWLLRTPPGQGLWRTLAQARVPRRLAAMATVLALLYTLETAGWQLIGRAALDGRLDMGWLAAWVLLLLTLVPLRLLGASLNAGVGLQVGLALRQRLLAGALRLDLDTLRRQGSGQLLARVIESQALESAGLAGVLGLGVALLELAVAAWVLAQGAAPLAHAALLAAWLAVVAALGWRHHRQLGNWTAQRLAMTEDLVERMVGHRTRLAQEDPARRDAEEDHALQQYLHRSQALDRGLLPVVSLAPGLWLLLGLAALAPALAAPGAGTAAATAALAISVGGLLFAHRALAGVSGGLAALARAAVAWRQAAPLFNAGADAPCTTPLLPERPTMADQATTTPLLEGHGLAYGYRPGAAPVLRDAHLQIGPHDRVLLAGPSGSGKSTLAALLVGLRRPNNGLLLIDGLDRATLGDDWHRRATEAPQFHDNHIFTGTLAFNLLMGTAWPPQPAALAEARTLCEDLGLGPLLARMPAGLQQRVGETGWQLSHGERSRVFLARALLQRAPLTVLDESFAALDPATLQRCLQAALQRTQALVVVAHP